MSETHPPKVTLSSFKRRGWSIPHRKMREKRRVKESYRQNYTRSISTVTSSSSYHIMMQENDKDGPKKMMSRSCKNMRGEEKLVEGDNMAVHADLPDTSEVPKTGTCCKCGHVST